MARTETVEFTNMCMICDGSRVVVIDRKKQDWPGITFPGGHIEPGESFTDAVIREVQEETGLHIRSLQLCGIKDWCEDQCRFVVLLYKTLVLMANYIPAPKAGAGGKILPIYQISSCLWICVICSGFQRRKSERVLLLSRKQCMEVCLEIAKR